MEEKKSKWTLNFDIVEWHQIFGTFDRAKPLGENKRLGGIKSWIFKRRKNLTNDSEAELYILNS